jgi:hypothetical protein
MAICETCGSVPYPFMTHAHACGETHLRPFWRAKLDRLTSALTAAEEERDAIGSELVACREYCERLRGEVEAVVDAYETAVAAGAIKQGDGSDFVARFRAALSSDKEGEEA